VIVCAVEMPRLDGYELCKAVKASPRWQRISVILASSHNDDHVIVRGFDAGADDYLTKPIMMSELLSRVLRMVLGTAAIRPGRLLLVDDSQLFRKMVVQALRTHGFQVDEAVSGIDALDRLEEQQYSLLLTDVEMAEMDGIALARAIRAHPDLSNLPIIALSGNESRADVVRVRSAGVQAFLAKPFQSDRLLAEVERVLAQDRLER
jgi:CheY-like chemotaxis protein